MEYLQENIYVPSETLDSVQKVLFPQYELAKKVIKEKINNDLLSNSPKNKIESNIIKNDPKEKIFCE